jgi:prepilin-type N-terminal cleavage/methylation domain-containing protein
MPSPRPRPSGFTLIELMVSVGILGLVIAGVVGFTRQALKIYYYDSLRLLVNRDIRTFTSEMLTNTVYSNYFQLYSNFETRRNGTIDATLANGQSGDFLVLVYASTVDGVTTVNRLVGYYRDPDASGVGPVRSFDVAVSPAVTIGTTTSLTASPPVSTMADLLDAYAPVSSASANPVVIQLAQGLSDGSLFYNVNGLSIMIKGQIVERQGTRTDLQAVNTYNFAVSPRG